MPHARHPVWKGTSMKVDSLIPASWFYSGEAEKLKINWFLYEYACKLFEYIEGSRKKALTKWKARRADAQLAEFCAYFAKRMRATVHMMHLNVGEGIVAMSDEEYIRDYCHENTRAENAALLLVCEAALVDLLEVCASCPVRCLDDMHSRCEIFDRMESGWYFS